MQEGKEGRARSDWRLSDLSNWAKGREGQGRTITTGERREKHAMLGHIHQGTSPRLCGKTSSALLNGKSLATLGKTKGKWKELAHTMAALWKCLLRKA